MRFSFLNVLFPRPGKESFHPRGFTLIEILVVLFIISIVASVAILTISHNTNKQLESFANELSQIVTLAEEQAMLQPSVLGLSFDDRTFHFSSFQAGIGENKKNKWVPLQDQLLGQHNIPNNIQVSLEVGGVRSGSADSANKNNPQIIISTNGDITPFTIYVGKRGGKPRYAVIGNADGNVTSKSLS